MTEQSMAAAAVYWYTRPPQRHTTLLNALARLAFAWAQHSAAQHRHSQDPRPNNKHKSLQQKQQLLQRHNRLWTALVTRPGFLLPARLCSMCCVGSARQCWPTDNKQCQRNGSSTSNCRRRAAGCAAHHALPCAAETGWPERSLLSHRSSGAPVPTWHEQAKAYTNSKQ